MLKSVSKEDVMLLKQILLLNMSTFIIPFSRFPPLYSFLFHSAFVWHRRASGLVCTEANKPTGKQNGTYIITGLFMFCVFSRCYIAPLVSVQVQQRGSLLFYLKLNNLNIKLKMVRSSIKRL
jgi:hypothetical protein